MKRKIRLTESEFNYLVKRLVVEAQETKNQEKVKDIIDSEVEDLTKNLSVVKIENMVDDLKKLQSKLKGRFSDLTVQDAAKVIDAAKHQKDGEMSESLEDRKHKLKKTAKIVGGLGLVAAGFLTMMSQGKTYSDWGQTFIALHDLISHLGDYAPNIGLASIVAGLITALKGAAMEKQKEDKKVQKENYYRRRYRRY